MKRRHILQSLAFAPLAFILPRLALADKQGAAPTGGLGALTEADPMGKALKYVEDATKADVMRTDKKAICGNCQKYAMCPAGVAACKPGNKTEARAACEIFGGKSVAKAGWCMSWVKA